METGGVVMEGDASERNIFVMDGYIVEMDQMKNLNYVSPGHAPWADGNVSTTIVLVRTWFVMVLLITNIEGAAGMVQMRPVSCVPLGTALLAFGNVHMVCVY